MEVSSFAYPKINLCLYVGQKREDGYHPIASIFQRIKDSEFFDRITIKITQSNLLDINVIGLKNVDVRQNTLYKSALLYLSEAKINTAITINIKKKIPLVSGLGGGSSDAATVLLLLNSVFKAFSQEKLLKLGAKIGSDVPFFICDCDTAIVEGRGELVSPIKSRTDVKYMLHSSDEKKLSTSDAYAKLDKRPEMNNIPSKEELLAMYNAPLSQWAWHNDFEILYKPNPYLLTGSGPWRFEYRQTS